MDRWFSTIIKILMVFLLVSFFVEVLDYSSSTITGPGVSSVTPVPLQQDDARWMASSLTITTNADTNAAEEEPANLTDIVKETTAKEEETFVDEYFEPIMESFRHPEHKKEKTKFRNGSEPTVLIVSEFFLSSVLMKESFYHINHNECPLPCKIIEDSTKRESADAILFYLKDIYNVEQLKKTFPDRDLSQPWILHATECPATAKRRKGLTYKSLNGIFNRTSYFRRDADITWTHGFVVSREDAKLLPPAWRVEAPTIFQQPFEKRNMAAVFISNCNDRSGRLEYIKKLSEYFTVHIYGKCGSRMCGRSRLVKSRFRIVNDTCLHEVAENYLFYLSFENNIAEDYATEKIYNILYYPVVPVVLGGADYSKLLPPNSYVNAMNFTPKTLAEHLTKLGSNEAKYNEMLKWRMSYLSSTVANRRLYCQICTRLYDPQFYTSNVYEDLQDWFVFKSHSNRRWNGENFTEFREIIKR